VIAGDNLKSKLNSYSIQKPLCGIERDSLAFPEMLL